MFTDWTLRSVKKQNVKNKFKRQRNLNSQSLLKKCSYINFKPSDELLKMYEFTSKYNTPSTGFCMILYYIHQCNLYDLHIINFGNGSRTENINSEKMSKNHNFEKEFNMIMNFHDNYNLTFLS